MLILLSAMTAGCENRTSNPTPKPSAYHRIELPDSSFTTYNISNVTMTINSAAKAATESKGEDEWLTVTYPQFPGTKIYLTLTNTNPTQLSKLIDNRRERIRLDIGDSTTELTELTSDGRWDCALFVTKNSVTTPIHILASNSSQTKLLSGALHIDPSRNPAATPDSIAPIVTICARDLLTTLKHIADK